MLKPLRSAFLLVALAVTGAGVIPASPARADDAPAASTHEQALQQPAGKFIQDMGDHGMAVVADKSLSTEARHDQFRDILRNSFDLTTIGRFVIGRTWNTATPDQQAEYMKLFQELVIKNYGDRLTFYGGEGFKVTGARAESDKDSIVNSQITHPDGSQPTLIDWRVRNRDGKFGVIDVVVAGVSLSVTQRQEYASVIQANNGQIDGLLAKMRQQVQDGDTGGAPASPKG